MHIDFIIFVKTSIFKIDFPCCFMFAKQRSMSAVRQTSFDLLVLCILIVVVVQRFSAIKLPTGHVPIYTRQTEADIRLHIDHHRGTVAIKKNPPVVLFAYYLSLFVVAEICHQM